MKKILSTLAMTALLSSVGFAANIQKTIDTSLADTVANTDIMKNIKETSMVCQSLGEIMQCINQSSPLAQQAFQSIGINTTKDNHPTITYVFESTDKAEDFCSYNMPNSQLKKCDDNAKLKLLFLSAEELSKSDLDSANKSIKEAYKKEADENTSQGKQNFEHTEYTAANGIKIETVASYESFADNNINLVINYIK